MKPKEQINQLTLRDMKDLNILNKKTDKLNKETADVLFLSGRFMKR